MILEKRKKKFSLPIFSSQYMSDSPITPQAFSEYSWFYTKKSILVFKASHERKCLIVGGGFLNWNKCSKFLFRVLASHAVVYSRVNLNEIQQKGGKDTRNVLVGTRQSFGFEFYVLGVYSQFTLLYCIVLYLKQWDDLMMKYQNFLVVIWFK